MSSSFFRYFFKRARQGLDLEKALESKRLIHCPFCGVRFHRQRQGRIREKTGPRALALSRGISVMSGHRERQPEPSSFSRNWRFLRRGFILREGTLCALVQATSGFAAGVDKGASGVMGTTEFGRLVTAGKQLAVEVVMCKEAGGGSAEEGAGNWKFRSLAATIDANQ